MSGWSLVLSALCLMLPGVAAAQASRSAQWQEGIAIPVRTALGIATQIALPKDEEILDYSIGFSQAWDVERRDQVIYLKPRAMDGATNLLVRTRLRQYIFELTVHAGTWTHLAELQRDGVAYRLDVQVPLAVPVLASRDPVVRESPVPQQCGYSMRRSRWTAANLAPLWVCDDGQRTVLRFADREDTVLPIVTGFDAPHKATYPVNYRLRGREMELDGVHDTLQLKYGQQLVEIQRQGVQHER